MAKHSPHSLELYLSLALVVAATAVGTYTGLNAQRANREYAALQAQVSDIKSPGELTAAQTELSALEKEVSVSNYMRNYSILAGTFGLASMLYFNRNKPRRVYATHSVE